MHGAAVDDIDAGQRGCCLRAPAHLGCMLCMGVPDVGWRPGAPPAGHRSTMAEPGEVQEGHVEVVDELDDAWQVGAWCPAARVLWTQAQNAPTWHLYALTCQVGFLLCSVCLYTLAVAALPCMLLAAQSLLTCPAIPG